MSRKKAKTPSDGIHRTSISYPEDLHSQMEEGQRLLLEQGVIDRDMKWSRIAQRAYEEFVYWANRGVNVLDLPFERSDVDPSTLESSGTADGKFLTKKITPKKPPEQPTEKLDVSTAESAGDNNYKALQQRISQLETRVEDLENQISAPQVPGPNIMPHMIPCNLQALEEKKPENKTKKAAKPPRKKMDEDSEATNNWDDFDEYAQRAKTIKELEESRARLDAVDGEGDADDAPFNEPDDVILEGIVGVRSLETCPDSKGVHDRIVLCVEGDKTKYLIRQLNGKPYSQDLVNDWIDRRVVIDGLLERPNLLMAQTISVLDQDEEPQEDLILPPPPR